MSIDPKFIELTADVVRIVLQNMYVDSVPKLLARIGATRNETERDSAGVRVLEGWEQLVQTTGIFVIGKKLILLLVCIVLVVYYGTGQ